MSAVMNAATKPPSPAPRAPKPVVDIEANWRTPNAPRMAMVARLRAQGVRDETVLEALASVPRERFIDAALASRAYEDTALPIGMEQTISQPYVVARMIEVMRGPKPFENVLEIGTGCGYQAAVLGMLAKTVHSIERIKGLHEKAKANFRHLRLRNVHLIFGDGLLGLPEKQPFDGIIVAAAGLLPLELRAQLAVGGKMVVPVTQADGRQVLKVYERRVAGFVEKTFDEVRFVPLLSGVVRREFSAF